MGAINPTEAEIVDESAERIAALEAAIREYLSEYETPSKDYTYRARCRERLRELLKQ